MRTELVIRSLMVLLTLNLGLINCVLSNGNTIGGLSPDEISKVDGQQIVITEIGQYLTPGFARDVVVVGDIAYVADMGLLGSELGGLLTINVSNPQNPSLMGQFFDGGRSHHFFVNEGDKIVFMADNTGGFEVLSVSDPSNITKIGQFDGIVNDIYVQEDTVYITDWEEGFKVLDVSNRSHPIELGRFESGKPMQPINFVHHFAYVSGSNELWILNVTDPSNITELANYNFAVDRLQVIGNTAYMVCSEEGFKIMDVSDPLNPIETGSYSDGGRAMDVHITGTIAIVSDRFDGLEILDIQDPSNPTELYQYYDGGNATDIHVVGNLIFVADGFNGLEIIQIEIPNESTHSTSSTSSTSSFELFVLIFGLFLLLTIRIKKKDESRKK
ncbi:MAG: LVIVD repeat-containing protein [Promethearchaeota archaeon]